MKLRSSSSVLSRPSAALPALLLLTLALVLFSGCSPRSKAPADQPVPVRLRAPQMVEQPATVAAGGSVEANVTAQCAFQIAGRVRRVLVEEGQFVRQGQLLAELDPADYQNAADAATAQADAARASAAKASAGLRAQELEQARIDFERWQDEYTRMKFLYERKSMAANDFQKVEAAYMAARQRYEMARQGTRSEDKDAASAQSRAAQAQATQARKRLADTRLLAPVSGFVGYKRIDAGDTVSAGYPVLSVLDLDPVKVRVGVPESEIGIVAAGGRAVVAIPSLQGKTFEGKVEVIGMAADPASRTYTVKIAVPNPAHLLRAGMVSQARLYGAGKRKLLTVPGQAIQRDAQGAPTVFVYDAARQRVFARRVEVGEPVGTEVEVRSGLNDADQVVVAGQQNLHEGSLVKLAGGQQ